MRKMRGWTLNYLKYAEQYYRSMARSCETRGLTDSGDYLYAVEMLDIIGAEAARRGV